MTGRRERRRKQLLDDLKGTRGYGKLEEEALYRPLWRTQFGRDYGPSSDCEMNEQPTYVATLTVLICRVILGTFSGGKTRLMRR